MLPVLIIVAVVAVVGIFAYVSYLAEKKRTAELEQVARDLGFEFAPRGDAAFLKDLRRFHLFSQGHSQKLWNLLRGTSNNLEVSIFDYKYVTGGGKNSHTWLQTVICFRFDGPALPDFSLRPENVWHKIGAWFGYQDIDFESHPAFSSKYLLRGSNEEAVRRLFTAEVLEFYESTPGLSTEGAGNTLLYYRHSVREKPEALRSFMEDGFKVLSLYESEG
jgi:hypothetical protein